MKRFRIWHCHYDGATGIDGASRGFDRRLGLSVFLNAGSSAKLNRASAGALRLPPQAAPAA